MADDSDDDSLDSSDEEQQRINRSLKTPDDIQTTVDTDTEGQGQPNGGEGHTTGDSENDTNEQGETVDTADESASYQTVEGINCSVFSRNTFLESSLCVWMFW